MNDVPATVPVTARRVLVLGASRNLGLGLARELAERGWEVIGTARGKSRTALHDLCGALPGRIRVEELDITSDDQLTDLRGRLAGAELDLLFVNAGIADPDVPAGQVSAQTFTEVMITNALAPMHAIDILQPLMKPGATIGVMSSRQGSIGFNTRGGHEVYRASKSALNQLMRSYAARTRNAQPLLLLSPGWVQTPLGGPGAELTVDDSARHVADVIEDHLGEPGLQFLSYDGSTLPW